jgi:hypothetical protein
MLRRRTCNAVMLLSGMASLVWALACEQTSEPRGGQTAPHARRSSFTQPSGRFVGMNLSGGASAPGAGTALTELGTPIARMAVNWFELRNGYHADTVNIRKLRDEAPNVEILASLAYRYDSAVNSVATNDAYSHCNNTSAGQRACVPMVGTAWTAWDSLLADWKALVNSEVRYHLAPGTQRITYWSPWNEANEPAFFNGQPWQYDSLARSMCDIIHGVNDSLDLVSSSTPRLTCVGPELAALPGSGNHIADATRSWLRSRLSADAFDIVAVHIYGGPAVFTTMVADVVSDKQSAGVWSAPLWITEAGHITPTVAPGAHDPELQDKGVYTTLNTWYSSLSSVKGLFWFDLLSKESGLMRLGRSQKRPAYFAFTKWQSNHSASTPGANRCNTETSDTTCDLTEYPPDEYQGYITAHIVDMYSSPVQGLQVNGYNGAGSYGIKTTDANGDATFRVNSVNGISNGLMLNGLQLDQAGYKMPLVTSSTRMAQWWDNSVIASPSAPHRYRTFVVIRPNQVCELKASAQPNPWPDYIAVQAYNGGGWSSSFQQTGSNGTATILVACDDTYGYGLNTWSPAHWPSGWTLSAVSSSTGGNAVRYDPNYYGYCDGFWFLVGATQWPADATNVSSYIRNRHECTFQF